MLSRLVCVHKNCVIACVFNVGTAPKKQYTYRKCQSWHLNGTRNVCFTSYTLKCNKMSVLGWILSLKHLWMTINVIKTLLEDINKIPYSFSSHLLYQAQGIFLSSLKGCLFCSFPLLHLKSAMLALNSVFKKDHKIIGQQTLITKSKRKSNYKEWKNVYSILPVRCVYI